jgi:hypothetical protein
MVNGGSSPEVRAASTEYSEISKKSDLRDLTMETAASLAMET